MPRIWGRCIAGASGRYRDLFDPTQEERRRSRTPILLTTACLLSLLPAWGPAPQAAPRLPLDDFEKAPEGWKYIGGEEFPGASGSLALDPAVAHGGKSSYRLEADFTRGGAYVGTWRDLTSLKRKDVAELRFWAKAVGIAKLGDFKLTWSDEFNDLSVSARGPGTRWIAHTPYKGDFGDAGFADPKDGFPFTVDKGILRIEAAKGPDGRWRCGLLSSVDPQGQGFSQKFGYFEMWAKFPKSLGMWPAFWLMGVKGITDKSIANPEVDVVEQYGAMPNTLMATLHTWGPGAKHWGEGDGFFVPGMTDDFLTYGALVEEKEIVIYYDGVELWRQRTPPEFKVPLYIMVDLALGGGWPIDKAVSPSYMYVDYVRAYARK